MHTAVIARRICFALPLGSWRRGFFYSYQRACIAERRPSGVANPVRHAGQTVLRTLPRRKCAGVDMHLESSTFLIQAGYKQSCKSKTNVMNFY